MDLCCRDIGIIITGMSEPGESFTIDIGSEGAIRGAQNVESKIKFFMPDQKRVLDIFLADIGFGLYNC